MSRAIVFLLFVLWAALGSAAELTATVDRTELYIGGEPLLLTVAIDDRSVTGQPDWSPLTTDFEILGRPSVMSSSSYINGVLTSSKAWELVLQPKRQGQLQIPPLNLGRLSSDSIAVQVKPAPDSPVVDDDLIIRASVDESSPYVQQQVIYTLSILNAASINREQEPRIEWPPGIVAQPLPRPPSGRVQMGTRFFFERKLRFALFAERSGQLSIPPPRYTAWLSEGRVRSPFARGKRVDVIGETVQLDVRPQPAEFTGAVWLPASQVSLDEEWPQNLDFSFSAGEPSSWLIRLRAEGQLSTQLPELRLDARDGARIYPDRSRTGDDFNGNWVGQREERFALVPDRPGPMMLPEVRVAWWDTEADQQREAVIPARQISVAPARNQSADEQELIVDEVAPSAPTAEDGAPSRLISRGGLVGWLLLGFAAVAAAGWWWRRRAHRRGNSSSSKTSGQQLPRSNAQWSQRLSQAGASGDSKAITQTLLDWANSMRPPQKVRSLGALRRLVADPALADQLQQLDQRTYGPDARPKPVEDLLPMLRSGWRWRTVVRNGADDGILPALYP